MKSGGGKRPQNWKIEHIEAQAVYNQYSHKVFERLISRPPTIFSDFVSCRGKCPEQGTRNSDVTADERGN